MAREEPNVVIDSLEMDYCVWVNALRFESALFESNTECAVACSVNLVDHNTRAV